MSDRVDRRHHPSTSPRRLRTPSDVELVLQTRGSDAAAAAARRELVDRYRPLVLARAARLHRDRGTAHDDVVSSGAVGLLKAVRDYDPTRGVPFAAYADAKVVGEMMRWFRDSRYAARVPRPTHERAMRVRAAGRRLEAAGVTEPTTSELARESALTPDQVRAAAVASSAAVTRRAPLPDDVPDTSADDLTAAIALRRALSRLDADDRALLVARYWQGLPQRVVGERLGVSQAHVSRRERRAIERLGDELRGRPADTG